MYSIYLSVYHQCEYVQYLHISIDWEINSPKSGYFWLPGYIRSLSIRTYSVRSYSNLFVLHCVVLNVLYWKKIANARASYLLSDLWHVETCEWIEGVNSISNISQYFWLWRTKGQNLRGNMGWSYGIMIWILLCTPQAVKVILLKSFTMCRCYSIFKNQHMKKLHIIMKITSLLGPRLTLRVKTWW